ncbi:MAG: GNAT family N-acetyltransferase [Burkholderiales bacterium]
MAIESPVLRIGCATDAVTVSALATQVYLDTYGPDGITPDLAHEAFVICSPEAFTARLASSRLRFFLAERKSRLVGFLELVTEPSRPPSMEHHGLEVARLYVQPAAQGQRIGSMLLREAEACASLSRCGLIWLTAWAGNQRALVFYRAQGFQDVGATSFVFERRSYENRILIKPIAASTA